MIVRFVVICVLLIGAFLSSVADAQTNTNNLGDLGLTNAARESQIVSQGTQAGTKTDIALYAGKVIEFILQALGLLFFIMIFWSGIRWLTAEGNEETVSKAKSTLTQAVWGMLIVAGAYALANFIVSAVQRSVGL